MQTQSVVPSYDFPVQLQPLFTKEGVEATKAKAVVRVDTNKVLSVVSSRYALFPHAEVMDAVKPFVKALGKPTTTHFLERDGARLVVKHTFKEHQAHLPAHGTTDRAVGDTVGMELLVINSYNQSTSLEFRIGALVLRCLNGMTVPEDQFSLKFRHLGNIEWKDQLPYPEAVLSSFNTAQDTWKRYADTRLEDEQRGDIIEEGLKLQVISHSAYAAEKCRFAQAETAWDLYNAFTYVTTHKMPRVQQSGKIVRSDRLNGLFSAFVH